MPLDVAATFIILFTIFGAVLEFSKAGEFYVNFSLAATGGKPAAAGRTVTLASFLLGGPSGSGVATTVTLGSVAWPLLAKAGYDKDSAGGLLSAGGIGAIISPPVLGAAAFLIAEFLRISYLEVLAMAVIPTILYYWSIFTMVESMPVSSAPHRSVSTAKYWVRAQLRFHFISWSPALVLMWGSGDTLGRLRDGLVGRSEPRRIRPSTQTALECGRMARPTCRRSLRLALNS